MPVMLRSAVGKADPASQNAAATAAAQSSLPSITKAKSPPPKAAPPRARVKTRKEMNGLHGRAVAIGLLPKPSVQLRRRRQSCRAAAVQSSLPSITKTKSPPPLGSLSLPEINSGRIDDAVLRGAVWR